MQEIMLAIVLGIAVGLANLLSYKIKFYLSKLSTLCLCTIAVLPWRKNRL